jgi:hypothetical protein
MHIDDLLGAEYLAAETGNTVLAKLDDGQLEAGTQTRDRIGTLRRLHVNDVGWANVIADTASRTFSQFDAFNHDAVSAKLQIFQLSRVDTPFNRDYLLY